MSPDNGNIHTEIAKIALERADGHAFEAFSQEFLSVIEGKNFIPLGGVKDGGADGIFDCGDGRTFYQITKQENHREKIRKTVVRLREFGREVKTVYYLSSRLIPHIDKEEDLLSEELDARIKIRDRKYIISHINDSMGTISAFNNHLVSFTQFLQSIARSDESFISEHVKDPTAFVFLQHEVTNRLGDRKLIHSLTDTMLLWSLSDTDPDKGIFMNEEDIKEKIFDRFPWTLKLLKPHIRARLELLRNKSAGGREIKWYRKDKKYCLPYETRESIKAENQHDESLKINFIEELKIIASDIFDADDGEYQETAEICSNVVHLIFERQGLLFTHFLASKEENGDLLVVSDCIDEILAQRKIPADKLENQRDYVENVIRQIFYHGSPKQREYLTNLSRTYVLLFSLQADPRIIEYFSSMSSSFNLFVGSDILVKSLSERYLEKGDQVARNLLKMASQAGISMYLSECVLEEIYKHIQGTNYEFLNHFMPIEPYVTRELARNSSKILVRAYFYAKKENKVKGWKSYIGQFMSYDKIEQSSGREELKKYLLSEYGLRFIENEELESACDVSKVNSLSEVLLTSDDKKNKDLAYNTALLVHGVYGLRKKNQETSSASEYGLRTWWMTNQSRIIKHTYEIVKSNSSKYIMRPEYLLNFIAMSPKCKDVRKSFHNIFPSNFGIQLGHRLKDDVFHKVLADVAQWKDYEPGRITALMSDLSDDLKSDRLKRYNNNLE